MKLLASVALASLANAAPSFFVATENQAGDTLMDAYGEITEMKGNIKDFKFAMDQITDGINLVHDGSDVLSSLFNDIEAESMTGTGINSPRIILTLRIRAYLL